VKLVYGLVQRTLFATWFSWCALFGALLFSPKMARPGQLISGVFAFLCMKSISGNLLIRMLSCVVQSVCIARVCKMTLFPPKDDARSSLFKLAAHVSGILEG
jgi:hypothetical protein